MPGQFFFSSRSAQWLFFVVSAAFVALGVHFGLERPWFGAAMLILLGLALLKRTSERRRARRLLTSGNVAIVLEAWHDALKRVPHAETMRPLVVATLLAAHGMVDKARVVLGRAKRGHAWEAALEHRLVVETLIDAFEGERERAVGHAQRLAELPMLPANPWMHERIKGLRRAVLAFAKSFAHESEPTDILALQRAAGANPLVHWPMRYAAAVAYLDHGQPEKAEELLVGAPDWPEESVFHHFHRELMARV